MSVRERLSAVEQYLAYVIGLGIALAIIAMLLAGLGSASSASTNGMLLVGLALVVIGTAAWLFLVRPWTKFDDMSTPLYTGHEEHAEDHGAGSGQPLASALPPTEPETAEDARLGDTIPASPPSEEAAEAAEPTGEGPVVPAPADLDADAEAAPDVPAPPKEPETAEEALLGEAVPASPPSEEAVEAAEPTGEGPVAPAPADLDAQAEAAPETSEEEPAAEVTPAADSGKRDNLVVIDGLGPRSQQVLYDAGITTFQAIANATPDMLNDILKAAGLRLVQADTWPEQAARLAAGDADRFGAEPGA